MSLTDSDDDVEQGSSAQKLLAQMRRRPHREPEFSLLGRQGGARDPESLESQLVGAGVVSPFNTWHFEEALRQQAFMAVDRRQHEIESYEQALQGALAELQRVRAVEESRLAHRVEDSTRSFEQQLESLQQQYLAEVEKLKRQTVGDLNKQRAASEATIAARVRALQGQLRHERPTSLMAVVAAEAGAATGSPSRPGPGLLLGSAWGGRPQSPLGTGMDSGSPRRPSPGMRMRSAPSARAANSSPTSAGGGAAAGAMLSPRASPVAARRW